LTSVVDTNVLVLADAGSSHAEPARANACINYLRELQLDGLTGLDAAGEILKEYSRNTDKRKQPGVGHAFLVWLFSNQYVVSHVAVHTLNPNAARGYLGFPADPALASFDRSDRKFVVVALTSGANHELAYAADSDWADHAIALRANGVNLRAL